MKNRDEIVGRIIDAWVLQELLYDTEEVFNNDELFNKVLDVIGAFSDIIYEIVGIGEEEQEIIQQESYDKVQRIKSIIKRTE